jgi:hypothetical protein
MSLVLNINENNLITFDVGIIGTSSLPSKVRVFIGNDEKRLCFTAKKGTTENEWIAEIPQLTGLLQYISTPVMCSIEIVVNGRTFIPYNREITLLDSKPENKPEENKPEENKPEENKPEENKPEENKPIDVRQVEENIKKEVKSLLMDIEKSINNNIIKEEKIKNKKSYKLKPFNDNKSKKIQQKINNKPLKDIMIIEDINLSDKNLQIKEQPIIQPVFRLIKKNIVYK